MNLYIMSRGRAGRVTTLKNLSPSLREMTALVVSPDESFAYKKAYPDAHIIQAPDWVTNYSDKFQWIMHDGMDDGSDKCVILDDDLRFATRVGEKHLAIATKSQLIDLEDAFFQMYVHLDAVPLVSFHPRQMAHVQASPYVSNGKVICMQGINRKTVGKIKVNQFPILADVVLNAYVLGMGWGNRLLTDVVQDHGSCQAPGGCSSTRTAEMQKEACEWLELKYPGYIKAQRKKPKGTAWLADEEGYRTDFRGQWKKLFNDAPWTKVEYDDR